jgi:hypothetical protein
MGAEKIKVNIIMIVNIGFKSLIMLLPLTLSLTAWEFKKLFFVEIKISQEWLKQNIFFLNHKYLAKIFWAVEVAPPFPLPPQDCGGGVVVALFSHKPWL